MSEDRLKLMIEDIRVMADKQDRDLRDRGITPDNPSTVGLYMRMRYNTYRSSIELLEEVVRKG